MTSNSLDADPLMAISDSEYSVLTTPTVDPSVTIAIPTFNRAALLKDCIHSVLAQSYRHFELLVSDNFSTDETPELLRTVSDRRLRVIRQSSNIGLLPNLNACLAAAKGDYFILLSDDDLMAPTFLERAIALIRSEPDVPIVIGLNDKYSIADGRTEAAIASQTLGTGVWDGADILLEYFRGNITIQLCTVMMRTEALRARGGFSTDRPYNSDVVAWAPLLLKGRAGLVNERCGTYVRHEATETSKHSLDLRLRDHRAAVNLIMAAADDLVENLQKLREIKLQAQHWGARHDCWLLFRARRTGEPLRSLLPLFWRYRRDVAMGNVFALARVFAIMILPVSFADWLRALKSKFCFWHPQTIRS